MADQSTAQNAEQPEKETYEKNTSHEIVTVDSLPNEIISSIALALAVDIHAPYVSDEYPHKENINACRHLTNLCMVSKRISSNAQKALYRYILLADAGALVLFYRTLLENPKLGTYVKRIAFRVLSQDSWAYDDVHKFFQSNPTELGALLSCAQHGLRQDWQFKGTNPGSSNAPDMSIDYVDEMILLLQFGVLGCTKNLELLDLHVQPIEYLALKYGPFSRGDVLSNVATEFLHSLWQETSLSLSRLQCLCLIGYEVNSIGLLSALVVFMCRCFLALPKLEQLVWVRHTDSWFDVLPNRMASGE